MEELDHIKQVIIELSKKIESLETSNDYLKYQVYELDQRIKVMDSYV